MLIKGGRAKPTSDGERRLDFRSQRAMGQNIRWFSQANNRGGTQLVQDVGGEESSAGWVQSRAEPTKGNHGGGLKPSDGRLETRV